MDHDHITDNKKLKVPFPRNQARQSPINNISTHFGEPSDLDLDSIVQKHIVKELRRDSSSIEDLRPVTDSTLLSSLTKRLSYMENQVKILSQALAEKDRQIVELQSTSASQRLMKENNDLKRQIQSMEIFLNDYGLVWVGHSETERTEKGMSSKDKEQASSTTTFSVDMDLLKHNIRELNLLAGEGQSTIVSQQDNIGTKRLKLVEPLLLTLYKNGFILGTEGPLRSFEQSSARAFISDIMDSYFPYELKDKFPDGVPLTLIDKHDEVYSPQTSVNNIRNLTNSPNAMDKQRFLSKLPRSVITNGKIVDVRSGIAEIIDYAPNVVDAEPVTIRTHVDPLSAQNKRHDDITAIQVKTEQGQKLVLKLRFDDTFKMLRHYIDPYVKKDRHEYELRTAFPPKVYPYLNQTLRSAGLVPNATLFIKRAVTYLCSSMYPITADHLIEIVLEQYNSNGISNTISLLA